MELLAVIAIAVGLSMDAFAVALACGMLVGIINDETETFSFIEEFNFTCRHKNKI